MTMSTPPAKQPTAMRRASRITSRALDGTERAQVRSRGALEREHRRLSRLCAGLRENAEEAERAQGELLAVLSHDLRNPLSVILMSTRMLSNPNGGRLPPGTAPAAAGRLTGPAPEPNRRLIEALSRAAEELSNLAQDMSDAGRLKAGRLSVAMQAVDVAPLVAHAINVMRSHAEVKNLRLKGEVADNVPPAFGDRDRMTRVLINLIGNAVKFTPEEGAVTVTVTASRRDDSSDASVGEVSVSDTGPGISIGEQAAIFEPYYRSEGTAALPGIGLGLAISQLLVKQMGGELALHSQLGQGATFTIRLPVSEGVCSCDLA
jgi:signal transduction histidine kinase